MKQYQVELTVSIMADNEDQASYKAECLLTPFPVEVWDVYPIVSDAQLSLPFEEN
jgi:hypothetical protein